MSILGQATAGDPSVDNSGAQPAPISGGIVSAAAPTAPVQTTPTPSQQPTQPAPTDSGSRLSRIISAVANVASTALQGIPDKGRPSFVTGLGEGARSEQNAVATQNAIKFKTFDDQVRAAQLHNQDLELQARTRLKRTRIRPRKIHNTIGMRLTEFSTKRFQTVGRPQPII